ncbi:MAG: hypothetical protein M1823_001818 [Watsoniomyces obsoletus]|nr:MAG: hypothetical protein M1823_001818 [Watsoniomyces obsoletus]
MLMGRGRGKIRAPRRAFNNAVEKIDVEALWDVLRPAILEIHTKNASELSFEELYRAGYRLVINKKGQVLYDRVKKLEESWLSDEVRTKVRQLLVGHPLTGTVGSLGTGRTEKRMTGEKFLMGIRRAWQDHHICMGMITDVLMYMDRVYCPDLRLPSIFTASMGLFRDYVLRSPLDPENPNSVTAESILNTVILDQIHLERHGDIIDRSLIRSCIWMLEGLYETDAENENERLYLTSFEPAFLEASRNFYRAEAQRLLQNSDAPHFLRCTRDRLLQEGDRCLTTISKRTAPKIIGVIENEVLRGNIKEVVGMEGSGARNMFDNDRYDDLKLLYEMVGRVDNKREALSNALYRRIVDMGMMVNDEAKNATSTSTGNGEKATSVDTFPKTTPSTRGDRDDADTAPSTRGDRDDADWAPKMTPSTRGDRDDGDVAPSADVVEHHDGFKTPKRPARAQPPPQSASSIQTQAAIRWVDEILALKDKYDRIWKHALHEDHDLQATMTRALSNVVNDFVRVPEFLSLFIDDNLRRGLKGKSEYETDEVLDKAVILLRYVRNKDMFERYYKKHLSKRLLGGRSVSNDVERQMISKMKLEIGNHFTQKLEGMFKDMTVSEELVVEFRALRVRTATDDSPQAELGIMMLTSTFWPTEVLNSNSLLNPNNATEEEEEHARRRRERANTIEIAGKCSFPPEIERIKRSFENFYHGKHTGRRLTWHANAGSADIKAIFPAIPDSKDPALRKERRHELNVSTYAMVILLLFNDMPSGSKLSYEEIQAKTMIPSGDLVRNLQSLAVAPKTRILVKEPMTKDVKATDQFSLNAKFSSKFLKIKVGVVAGVNRIEGEKERKDTEKKNDEMRGGIIEAAVVRIMKGRKLLAHQNLCSEVIGQLSYRFTPDLAMIKKRIESLIEREYIERVEGEERATYKYLA